MDVLNLKTGRRGIAEYSLNKHLCLAQVKLTFAEQVNVAVCQQDVQCLQVALHVTCAHAHHLKDQWLNLSERPLVKTI